MTSGLTNLNLQESSSFSTPQKSGISTVVIKKKTRCDNESLEVSPVSSTSKVGEFIDFEAPAVGTERPPEYWEIADGFAP